MKTQLLIGGRWTDAAGGRTFEVRSKWSDALLGTVPEATAEDVAAAVAAAKGAADAMARLPTHRRADALLATARALGDRRDEIGRTIAGESGKALKFALAEVDRAVSVFTLAAEESRRIHGETVALDAVPSGEGYRGFWQRRPIGPVAAITPFNFPLNLVAHKVAPAIAAGNPVVLKPAEQTPLTAVLLGQILCEVGLPDGAVNIVQGPGETVGDALVRHPGIAKVSFTGSRAVGELILKNAGIKKVTLELGNSTPVIVAADADLDHVAQRCALGAYYNSGQVCISVQRIYGDPKIGQPLRERLVAAAEKMVVGDPLDAATDVGPMIAAAEAERAESWLQEAKAGGARVLTGGRREGAVFWPTVLDRVKPDMRVVADEVFAPITSVLDYDDFEQALAAANATPYGLQAAVFTRDIDRVLRAIDRLDFGGVIINDSPVFRADHMPYGGNRGSGLGREGLRFAIEEMTNIQMVVIRAG